MYDILGRAQLWKKRRGECTIGYWDEAFIYFLLDVGYNQEAAATILSINIPNKHSNPDHIIHHMKSIFNHGSPQSFILRKHISTLFHHFLI